MADGEFERRQVLAFRALRHGLARRQPSDRLIEAIRPLGLRRTRNAVLSLSARVDGVGSDDLLTALRDQRLVAFYGARGTVMLAPPEDVAVLSIGVAPTDEPSLRASLPGAFVRQLDAAGLRAADALAAVIDAVRSVLASGPMPRGECAMAATRELPRALTPPCRGRCPDPHVEDSLFRLAGINGVMRFHKDEDVLVACEYADGQAASDRRADLVRRYLSCYGPSTPTVLAAWAGISKADAKRSLDDLGEEVRPVTVEGKKGPVLLTADRRAAASATAGGLRLLPPFDPYLLDRDRDLLVPDRAAQQTVWRASGNPGVVLSDGEPVATWRTRKRSGKSSVVVEPFDSGAALDDDLLHEEAERLSRVIDG